MYTTTGSANAYVLTTGLSLAAYVSGQSFLIKPNFTNSGAATIAVDGLTTKSITKNGTTALASGDLVSGRIYRIGYDGTQFQVLGVLSGVYQPLEPTLTAFAAVAWSSGNQFPYLTAADTFALGTITANGLSLVAAANYAAMRTLLDLEAGTDFYSISAADSAISTAVSNHVAAGDPHTQYVLSSEIGSAVQAYDADTTKNDATNIFTTGALWLQAAFTRFVYDETDAGSNQRIWDTFTQAGIWSLRTRTDADGSAENAIRALRTGTVVDEVEINATLIDINGAADISGNLTVGGSLLATVAVSSETSGTLSAASANRTVRATGTCTINDGVFSAEHRVEIYAGGSSRSIAQDTGMTLRLDGTSTTGSRTLAARGRASIYFVSSSEAIVSGMGVT